MFCNDQITIILCEVKKHENAFINESHVDTNYDQEAATISNKSQGGNNLLKVYYLQIVHLSDVF